MALRISANQARRLGALPKKAPLTDAQRELARAQRKHWEDALADQLARAGYVHGTHFEREARLVPGRKFRVDFAFHPWRTVVEVEGGIWMARGAHSGGAAISRDIEKYDLLTAANWKILRFSPEWIKGGMALDLIRQLCPLERRTPEAR